MFARRFDLIVQIRMGLTITFAAAALRAVLHSSLADVPMHLQQALLFMSAIGAQFAFPVLTLQMLDLFPAARGTASAAQSFVALLITAFTLGIVAPHISADLRMLAWTSVAYTVVACTTWYFARRWHRGVAVAV
jgi:DHA1 family bicyclomycin/chloramphenicol resistance-like MFS transporter